MSIKKIKKEIKVILLSAKKRTSKIKRKITKITIELNSLMDAIEQASSQYSEIEPEVKEHKNKTKKK